MCLFRNLKLALGHMSDNFIHGLRGLVEKAECGNWYLLYANDVVTLFAPNQSLPEIVGALRGQRDAHKNKQEVPKALFVALNAHFSAKIGLSGQTSGVDIRQPVVDSARRLEQLLLEWTQTTVCNLAAPMASHAEENSKIEKEIEFAIYDLVGHTRGGSMQEMDKPSMPVEYPFLAGRRQILNIVAWLRENFNDPTLCATKAAKQFRISVRQLHKLFERNEEGLTFLQTLKSIRLQHARTMLETPDYWHLSIADIAEKCGFSGSVYFGRIFRQHHKVSPGVYRKQKMDSLMQQYALGHSTGDGSGKSTA
jgi:AraC-like DNA-binding protein